MKKNKYMSIINVYSLLITTCLEIILGILFTISLIIDADIQFKLGFILSIAILLGIQYVIIKILNLLFSSYGKYKLTFSHDEIMYKKEKIKITDETRIVYSRMNLENLLTSSFGILTIFENGKGINLGAFTGKEIRKMKKYLPNIKYEIKIKKLVN